MLQHLCVCTLLRVTINSMLLWGNWCRLFEINCGEIRFPKTLQGFEYKLSLSFDVIKKLKKTRRLSGILCQRFSFCFVLYSFAELLYCGHLYVLLKYLFQKVYNSFLRIHIHCMHNSNSKLFLCVEQPTDEWIHNFPKRKKNISKCEYVLNTNIPNEM